MSEKAAVQVFIGTKAQYIKTVPVIQELERREVPYRLIDSGQHGAFSRALRDELRIREPDYTFGDDQDVATIPAAIRWSIRLLAYLVNRKRLSSEVFPSGLVCVVHGDTPSTLLSSLLARRAGLEVAHLEAGLRSFSILNPFPEELIRVVVMKLSTVLFAPNPEAVRNLQKMRIRGTVVPLSGNTVVESVGSSETVEQDGPVVVTVHRVENLHRRRRLRRLIELVDEISKTREVLFVVHPPTREALTRYELERELNAIAVEIRPLMPHSEFVACLRRAPFVITDGGSIQEECALIGVPTLLWREHTERGDGLGANVVLSRFDEGVISEFLRGPEAYRGSLGDLSIRPSAQIVDYLEQHWVSAK